MATTLTISFNVNIHKTILQKTPKSSKFITTQNLDIKPAIKRKGKRNSAEKLNFSLTKTLLSYVKSGDLENALCVFDNLDKSDPFPWNIIIRCLTDKCLFEKAIQFYYRMQDEGIKADNFTFPFVIKACTGLNSLVEGEKVHAKLIKIGLDLDLYICNALIVMYAKTGCIENSEKIFVNMPVKDIVTWNSMISGYVSVGDGNSSLTYFRKMQVNNIIADRFSLISSLCACSLENFLLSGKEIHCRVIKGEFESDSMIETSLIDMYGKCGKVDYSKRVFDKITHKNVVHWNVMIAAYSVNGRHFEALSCLEKMQENDGLVPDAITLINALPSCSNLGEVEIGKSIHAFAIKRHFLPHLVMETAMIHMYGNCGSVKAAKLIYLHLKDKNLISWNAMISAYVHNRHFSDALELFQVLQNGPYDLDEMTITGILPAYAETALPKEGAQVHGYITKLGYASNTFVSNSIIYMYTKCGDLKSARKFFDLTLFKDVVTWNTMIMSYAIHGLAEVSISLFYKMKEHGVKPNESTFVSVLTACSVAGMADKGWEFFNSMEMEPRIEHYGCMVDLLGRFGNLDQAKHFIEKMPLVPTARIWGSFLEASRHHGNIELAELAMEKISLLEHEHDNTGSYVLLSNMYAEAGKWEDVERIKRYMKKQGLEKSIGSARVEYNSESTHLFTNYDQTHSESAMIYETLYIVSRKIGEGENVNITKFKPRDLIRRREDDPMFHSVRLAICCGIISTSIGNPIVVRKNVRICEDCHNAAKKISEITKREIIVGDSKIYHHFKKGHCSCNNYW